MISRRALLGGACALCACRPAAKPANLLDSGETTGPDDSRGTPDSEQTTDSAVSSCEDSGIPVDGWVEIPLSRYPELDAVGGYAVVDVPEQLLHLLIIQLSQGCYAAIWRICTHGACETEWDPGTREAVCPCHGSTFGPDGAIHQGPATTPLRAFPVVRRGDSLWIQR